ncbi:MAG: hypothetical protein KJZ84_24490 [Bryobacteraceae bacterium]|nr:hypothetical protein [Bryobacteraceae bacterium]
MNNKLELVIEVDTKGANASIKSVNSSLSSMEAAAVKTARGASSGIDSLTVSIAKGAAAANVLSNAFERVVGWLKEQIVETSRLAARNETLAVVNAQLARANGYSEGSIERLVGRVKELGITTQASRDIVNKMIASQLDLSKATELARLAQDAAVVSGQDSSQALQGIIAGITTQQIEVLRTYGINIQFERAFTEARRRLGRDLTEIERRNTALNVVLAEGPKIAGAYEASLGTVGKQIGSLNRYIEEAKAAIGTQFLPEMRKMIEGLTDLAKWVGHNSDAIALWAKGIAAAAVGTAVAQFITWLGGAKKAVDALTLAMARNPFTAIAIGALVAGTAIYEMNQKTLEAHDDLLGLRKAAIDTKEIMAAVNAGKSAEDLQKMGYSLDQVREAMFGGKDAAKEFFAAFDNEEFRQRIKDLNQTGIDEEEMRRRKAASEALAKDIGKQQANAERESAEALLDARRRGLSGFARDIAAVDAQVRKWVTHVDDKGIERQIDLTAVAWENVLAQLKLRLEAWQQDVRESARKQLAEQASAEEAAVAKRMELESRAFSQRLSYNEEIASRNLDHSEQWLRVEEDRAGRSRDAQLRALEATDAQTLEQKVALEQRRTEIEIEHIVRVHEIRMQLFELENSRFLIEEESNMRRLGYQADEIQARLAEIAAQRDAISGFEKESVDAAVQSARETAAVRQAQLIRDQNLRVFDSFKRQAEGVFDALLTKSQSVWAAIGNSLKTALLTAIKEVVTSRVALMLMQMFGGVRMPVGGMGGGLAPVGGVGALGALAPMVGAPGGTGGFSGPVGALGGGASGWKGFLGFGGGVQYAPGKAVTWEAATMGQKLSALGRSDAALAGGAALGLMGLQRGGWSGLAMTTAGGAMIGYKFGGPVGAAIGAGVGAAAGFIRMLFKGRDQKLIDEVRSLYGITIDKQFARTLAEQSRGQDLRMFLRSPQVREQIEAYAAYTGQRMASLDNTPRGVNLAQSGGVLAQAGTSVGGSLYGYASGLPSFGGLSLKSFGSNPPPQIINVTIQADGQATESFLEGKTVQFVTRNGRAVQQGMGRALQASEGRTQSGTVLMDPLAAKV